MRKLSGVCLALAMLLSASCPRPAEAAPVKPKHSGNAPPLRFPVSRKNATNVPPSGAAGGGGALQQKQLPVPTLSQRLRDAETKDGYKLARDVSFASDRQLSGDLYLPLGTAANAKMPAILLIHEGAWIGGDKRSSSSVDLAERLVRHGYIIFSADYRLIKDGGIYPQSVKDVRDALGFLAQNASQIGIDSNGIGVFGASVGGTMALLVAYTPNSGSFEGITYKNVEAKPKVAVAYCPLTDMRDTELTWVIKYMDDTPWHTPELFAEASPITHVKSGCPTLCIHGTDDVTVSFKQSQALVKELQAAGIEAGLVPIAKVRHIAFNELPVAARELAFARLLEFFDKHLKH
jgi:acetyl esterase/lipase